MNQGSNKPLGVGLGLRFQHFDDILANPSLTPWFEVITDDFLSEGPHHDKLHRLRQEVPLVFHSVGLNIGGTDPFDRDHLESFKRLYHMFQPAWISDHLCWSAHGGLFHHDLLPIPRSAEALKNVCQRIAYLQDFFGREICLENITSYLDFQNEDMSEVDFIKEVTQQTGCKLLLDISNVLVNHKNRGQSSQPYFADFPLDHVLQIHLSGPTIDDHTLIDSHAEPVPREDVALLKWLRKQGVHAPAMIERDSNLPSYQQLALERHSVAEAIDEI